MSSVRALRAFLVLWAGQTLSQLGSAVTSFALIVWAYSQQGTVMSVALLSVCSYLPAAVASVFAGALVDRARKKTVMLCADTGCALVTLCVLVLWKTNRLQVSHLYALNALMGVLGAFQGPASQVAVTLLTPKEHYMRVSGLQSFSGSLCGILSPVLGAALLAFGGLDAVLLCDLATFLFAFVTLGFFVRLPGTQSADRGEKYLLRIRNGVSFIRKNKGLLGLLLYLVLLNLIAGIAYYSVLSPMILARTGGSEQALGAVNACVGLGALLGAVIVTLWQPKCGRVKLMCICYTLSFALADGLLGVGRTLAVWCVAAVLGNLPLPMGDGALTVLLRENVPSWMQGRVFAVKNMLVSCAVTAGYLLGAVMADTVAPALVSQSPFLTWLMGTGDGRAMGLVFVLTSVLGIASSLSLPANRHVRALEAGGENNGNAPCENTRKPVQ